MEGEAVVAKSFNWTLFERSAMNVRRRVGEEGRKKRRENRREEKRVRSHQSLRFLRVSHSIPQPDLPRAANDAREPADNEEPGRKRTGGAGRVEASQQGKGGQGERREPRWHCSSLPSSLSLSLLPFRIQIADARLHQQKKDFELRYANLQATLQSQE